jgi:hypothetical protein
MAVYLPDKINIVRIGSPHSFRAVCTAKDILQRSRKQMDAEEF